MTLLSNLLTLYTWGGVCVLLFFLYSIARFFEKRLTQKQSKDTQRRPYYPFFWAPVVLFALSAILYSLSPAVVVGHLLGDVFRVVGAIALGAASYFLLNTMTGGKS